MAALKGKAIDAFIARRDLNVAAVLVYGPDAGLVKERGDALARSVTPDFKDPFNYIELTDADLKGEPGRLADEATALSFMAAIASSVYGLPATEPKGPQKFSLKASIRVI